MWLDTGSKPQFLHIPCRLGEVLFLPYAPKLSCWLCPATCLTGTHCTATPWRSWRTRSLGSQVLPVDFSPHVCLIIVPSTQEQGSNFSDAKSAGCCDKTWVLFEWYFEAILYLLQEHLRRYQERFVLVSISEKAFPNGLDIPLYLIFLGILSVWHVS